MTDGQSMTIVLPEKVADRIRSTVESGEYATASEAVLDAVALWSAQRDVLSTPDIERLRRAWDDGIASDEAEPYEMTEILADVRSKPAVVSRG